MSIDAQLQGLPQLARRRVFVSYHHGGDRHYYDAFSQMFAGDFAVVSDTSVDRAIESDNAEYVMRKIREEYLTGSSCTIVLCGAETRSRKFVDWEIKATLDKEHGLIGIQLPTNPFGRLLAPDRLEDNLQTQYALWIQWDGLNPQLLASWIEMANSRLKGLINNSRALRMRNGA